ncbi:hypothetical protein BDA99DRAFT_561080 [Phascolomyces articulosus]|uniref:Uncharacterized protein n=1 Tax=Phascolomyces articulosus TaxID=60185 RepID=A0AAD5JY16_9FUNG|nr:hypothetical protein BDA99DRAFT_561080 [Phascolomyces articulosus]
MTQHQRHDPLRKEHYHYYDRHDAVIQERSRQDAQLDQDILDLLNACLPAQSTTKNNFSTTPTNTTSTTTAITKTISNGDGNDGQINNSSIDNDTISKRSQRRRRRSPTFPLTMTDIMWTSPSSSLLCERATKKSLDDTNNNKPTTIRKSVTFNDNVRVVMF